MTPKEFTFDAAYQPQVRAKRGTREIMLDVIIALLPALCVGVWQFGAQALIPLAVSIVSCVFFEWAYRKLMKKPDSIGDLSAVVTGVILAYNLPVSIPLWQAVFGCLVAIVAVKQLFGGIGKNFANPALVGRIVLFLSFSKTMTAWVFPDAVSSATPLAQLAAGQKPELLTLLLGNHGGCIGETCALALLLGGAYLLVRGVITWQTPACFVGTVFVLSLVLGQDALRQVLSGGLLLGAFFMATDYSTSPVTAPGRIIYGVGCGALTVLIRVFGGFPEGVSFAILIMNCCAWMFDKHTQRRQFGVSREDVKAKKAAAKAAKKEAKEAAANG